MKVLAGAAVGAAVQDSGGAFVEWNARLRDILAVSDEELAKTTEAAMTHPEDQAAEDALLQDLLAGRRRNYVMEKRYLRRNRSIAWVRASVTRLDDGHLLRLIEDISDAVVAGREAERFQSESIEVRGMLESRLRQQEVLARMGRDALLGVDLRTVFQRTCEGLAEVLQVTNTKVLQLTPERDAVLLRAGVGWKEGLVDTARISIGPDSQAGYTLTSGHPVVVRDLRRETRFSGPPLLHDHGIVSGMSVIISGADQPWGVLGIHDQKERVFTQEDVQFLQNVAHLLGLAVQRLAAEERLRQVNESLERTVEDRTQELQESYESMESFSYTVAHELRAPLGLLDQFAARAADRTTGKVRDNVEAMQGISQQMLSFVNSLLDFARASHARPVRQQVDAAALARDVAAQRQKKDPNVQFEAPEGEVLVDADPQLLRVVLENLLGNAWKFSAKQDRPHVRFGTKGGEPPVLYVEDNGIGFAPEQADEVFVPFRRLDYDALPGSGVGLATVKRIVERHGGRVWAESAHGKGATFFFTL